MSKPTKAPEKWRNRIVSYGEEDPEQLLASESNWRIHPRNQQTALAGVLSEVGIVQNIIVNKRTSDLWGRDQNVETLVDGHLRVSLALSAGQKTIPITYVDLTPAEEAEVLATLDPLSAMAATDKAKLDELLRSVQSGDAAVQAMLAELAKKNGLDYGMAAEEDPGAQIDRAEELRVKWQTQAGQLWLLPSKSVPGKAHRLLCGDSTKAEDVARLMDREQAHLVWTDPPYGVGIVGGTHDPNRRTYQSGNRIENDDLTDSELDSLLRLAFGLAKDASLAGAAWYVAAPPGPLHHIFASALRDMGIWRQTLNWVKHAFVFGRCDYHYRHEPIFYGWVEGAPHYFTDDRTQDTIWEYDRPGPTEKLHPTVKPTELVARAIRNSSRTGEVVYDPFLGSGTTMVAAEQTGRIGYGCDISPAYIAVALQRLADMGLEPRLADD